jgi:hypothetical protein
MRRGWPRSIAAALMAVAAGAAAVHRSAFASGPHEGALTLDFTAGYLTLTAQHVPLARVAGAIESRSGVKIILVNVPAHPPAVTVAVKHEPLPDALGHIVGAVASTPPLSFTMIYDRDSRVTAVDVFFPAPAGASLDAPGVPGDAQPDPSGAASAPDPSGAASAPDPSGVAAMTMSPEDYQRVRRDLKSAGTGAQPPQ